MIAHRHLLLIFLLSAGSCFAQLYESVEENALGYFLALATKSNEAPLMLEHLKSALTSVDQNDFEKIYQSDYKLYDSLIQQLAKYESGLKNISSDSALVLYNQWYLQFCNTFYDYSRLKFFQGKKDKVLFFSASMSCYCTLEMCKNQAIDILRFAKAHNLDYWIIDSYEHNELQIKYETLFAPSVILFDSNNKILTNIEYDEKMIELLNNFYSNRE